LCSSVAENGEHVDAENKEQSNVDEISNLADGNLTTTQPLRLPVVAPALKNLGIFCHYYVSIAVFVHRYQYEP